MKNIFSKGFLLLALIISSLFIGQVLANGIGCPNMAIPIAGGLSLLSFVPVNQVGMLAVGLNATDILYAQGRSNPGGIKNAIFYAFAEDVKKWPAAITNINTELATTFEEIVTIPAADAFEFYPGKSFKKLYCTLETGELKFSLIGARDSKSFSNSMEVSYPSNDEKILGFIAASANRELVFLVPEQNGRIKVLGTPGFPAQLETVEGTTGKLVEDGNVAIQTFLSKSPIPAPIYKAPVLLEPAIEG